MSFNFLRLSLFLIAIALVQGHPPSERTQTPLWGQILGSFFWDIGSDAQNEKAASREVTPFERRKELNGQREPIVWRFNSFGRIELDALIDPNRQIEIDNSQIRCLGLQCLRIIFKLEPIIANCEYSKFGFQMKQRKMKVLGKVPEN